MALFQNLFKPAAPAPPAPVPAALPGISSPTASQIAQHSNPSPAAAKLLTPQQTPSQYLNTLQDHKMGDEMVKTMAHGMPDREGVHWAAQSAEKVSDKLPPHEVQGMKAAQAWAKNPTPANQAAAASAAAKGGCQGPGSMAAQGAAWAKPATPAVPGAAVAPRLTPHAVTGAVLMSSAIQAHPALAAPAMALPSASAPAVAAPSVKAPQMPAAAPQAPAVVPPAVQAQTFQQQHPFIALGLDIAGGKNSPG
jgi:hypothetical protein